MNRYPTWTPRTSGSARPRRRPGKLRVSDRTKTKVTVFFLELSPEPSSHIWCAPRTRAMRRDAARQIRAGFVALASVAALIHLVGVDNTSGRASILARGAGRGGRGDDALRFLGPGARRQLLSSHCAVGQKWNSTHCVDCTDGRPRPPGNMHGLSRWQYSNAGTGFLCRVPGGKLSSTPTIVAIRAPRAHIRIRRGRRAARIVLQDSTRI